MSKNRLPAISRQKKIEENSRLLADQSDVEVNLVRVLSEICNLMSIDIKIRSVGSKMVISSTVFVVNFTCLVSIYRDVLVSQRSIMA